MWLKKKSFRCCFVKQSKSHMKHYCASDLNVWKCTQSTKFCQSYTLVLKKTNHYCKEGPHVKNIVLPTYNNCQLYT